MSYDLNNKIALITGANRGIGKAIVESFFSQGVKKIYLAVRNIESTAALVKKYGDKVVPLFVDVSQTSSVQELALQAKDVDIVVNNAGILEVADPLSDNAEEALQKEFNINTLGLIRVAQAFTPILEARAGAAFVQLNSVASIKNFLGFTTYSASKAAAYSITQGLKAAFDEKNIQLLSVHPGPIATAMGDKAGLTDIAEPASVVAEGIVSALKAGDFHLFPDALAKNFEAEYKSYAENIIEAEATE